MTNAFLVSGLKEQYARTLGELRSVEARRKQLKRDMANLKATIKLCAADLDLSDIEPVAPKNAPRWFADGQCARTTVDILRTATGPLTVREIAIEAMRRRGIEASDDYRTFKGVCMSVRNALRHREGVDVVGTRERPKRWRIAG